jgi:hypothetical protein
MASAQQQCTAAAMAGFDVYLQSPTLSSTSSTNSSTNGICKGHYKLKFL